VFSMARSSVFDGVAGVEPQSETVWRQADRYRRAAHLLHQQAGSHRGRLLALCRHDPRAPRRPARADPDPDRVEEKFQGVVDLIAMKAIVYKAEDLGAESEIIDIPADLLEQARARREKMIEVVAEMDDELTHKYLEGHTLSPEDIKRA